MQYDAYDPIKRDALQDLKALDVGPAKPVSKELAKDILKELADAEYEWSPELHGLNPDSEDVKKLYQFLLGGMIFGEYADRLESEHGSSGEAITS